MPDADALAALATAYARHAQLPQALQFYAQIKRSFRLVLLSVPPASIYCDANKASLHRRDCGTASAYCSMGGAPKFIA